MIYVVALPGAVVRAPDRPEGYDELRRPRPDIFHEDRTALEA